MRKRQTQHGDWTGTAAVYLGYVPEMLSLTATKTMHPRQFSSVEILIVKLLKLKAEKVLWLVLVRYLIPTIFIDT